MMKPTQAPFGTWTSPLTAQAVSSAALRLGGVTVDGEDIYWLEGRPSDGGRIVLVKRSAGGTIADVTPPGTNVRTRVHEYGGGAYAVSRGTVYYSEFSDQRLYTLTPGGSPEPLTPPGRWFYADGDVDERRRRLVCVREDHSVEGSEAVSTLVSVPLDGPPTPGLILASGHDFYSTPRLSPDGTRLSWLAWRHPQMPWDGNELWMADMSGDGTLEGPRRVAGGETESIFQPGWLPDGSLCFVSDRTGWWNLWRLDNAGAEHVFDMEAEFGRAQWALGASTWAAIDDRRLLVAYTTKGRWRLATLDLQTKALRDVPADVEPGESLGATRTHAVLVGGGSGTHDAVVRIDLATGSVDTLRASAPEPFDARLLSTPEAIEFPTDEGRTAFAFYYPPFNPAFTPPPDERPPLIVICHGGPTASTHARLSLEVQYWTTRGFALVDVNYGGSVGYGRAYRQRLNGRWGIVDVVDAINAARHLSAHGKADADRLVIRGRSAGGYTTLAALTFHPGVFKAGASYYGVADLELLARDTHKFESRYLDTLIGPYPARRDLYRARSPIAALDQLSSPLILFQGEDDRIVPLNQAQLMADQVRARGIPVALHVFQGEQHGFRKAETIATCLEEELRFYGSVFGIAVAAHSSGSAARVPD